MDDQPALHPAIRDWFEARFPAGPTEAQAEGWPAIAAGQDTLIAAPTGSGKTLAAFLMCINQLFEQAGESGELEDRTQVLYISPLKALTVDIQQNLETPLAEIRRRAEALGIRAPAVRALVRSGDTPSSARAAMLKRPPHILITTPESLFLLVTAQKSREALRSVRTVIVDEIHAVAGDKRGSHLALTLERLEALCDVRPTRIGLSATQRPIETVARLLVGAGEARSDPSGAPLCTLVDRGHRRTLDLGIEVPDSELEAVASHEQWDEMLDRIATYVDRHRTTLVFVNTRRMAERLAHRLAERLGEERVASHHGSLSKDRRLRVEERLRAGQLGALVATASLELGIDIGPVELVCHIGSPRRFSTFLQRVGRSGHTLGAIPKGRIFPTTRDELVECAALVRGTLNGSLDRLVFPLAPLDILAQQIVAACAADEWREEDLFALVRRAAPFAALERKDFDATVEMLSEGITTGRGRRAAYLHRDRIHGVLRGRRGARLAALTSGGAIPDTADYRVVADPDDTFVGTVNEDWAIESQAGDIFLLGSTSWQIRRIESGIVRVTDAHGAPPTVPFWLGEAPARSAELSEAVSVLRAEIAQRLADDSPDAVRAWLEAFTGVDAAGADQLVRYVAAAAEALGVVPSQSDVVVERFFDETGGMQLVLHAPFGGRINRGLGLALRKRFCRSFDFELQAAANDDAVVLSLGPQHSFPLEDLMKFLTPTTVRTALSQAFLDSPMFTARWRWNLGRALAVLRFRGGKKNPPPIQRMEADDFMAALFPSLAACQENVAGPIEIPDHPLVQQTIHDCLTEASDIEGLERVLAAIASGSIRVHSCDTTEPSPLAHEILNGRPYTFLDDAPLEERRTRAVALRRGLPESGRDLGRLDASAIERVRDEARPQPRDSEELHDALLGLVILRPRTELCAAFDALTAAGRASVLHAEGDRFWVAAENLPLARALFPAARFIPELFLPEALSAHVSDAESARLAAVRGHLDCGGPVEAKALADALGQTESDVLIALAALEAEGFALRGRFDSALAGEQFCARRLLARIHAYTQERLRKEIEPVTAQDFLRFLFRWQHAAPDVQREGRRGLLAVVEQLQGFELAAGAWEKDVFAARVAAYRSEWLDELCFRGEVLWGRLAPRATPAESSEGRGGRTPSRATPITLAQRADCAWLLPAVRGEEEPQEPGPGAALDLLDALRERGPMFHAELAAASARLPVEIEEGLWELVSRGLVSADGFAAVRNLLGAREAWGRRRARGRRNRRQVPSAAGRWARLLPAGPCPDRDTLAEAIANQLLRRWGVVFRDLMVRESFALPWREILYAFRRLEARGTIRGGRFVTGFVGEQYALPGAVEALRRTRRRPRDGERVRVGAADPLNLVGILTPGPRIPTTAKIPVIYRDGLPVAAADEPRQQAS